MHTNIVAEIGINANNDLNLAKKLIDIAAFAGCDFVKFQKRNPDICVPEHQKNQPKTVPWRENPTTYLQYKKDIEFSKNQYKELEEYCVFKNIGIFASVWDKDSVDDMKKDASGIMKIPSALITDIELCKYARKHCDFLMISTGMSTEDEIEKCIRACNPNVIFHTNSTYPSPVDELNLNYIDTLKSKWPGRIIGYSGHEFGLVSTFAAVVKGAQWIERHITLDRTMWGSDQMASVEPTGLIKLVKGIRDIEKSMGPKFQNKRILLESEKIKRKSLRK